MKNWTHEWLFPGGKIHRERNALMLSTRYVDMLCGATVHLNALGEAINGEARIPPDKVPPVHIRNGFGRRYRVRHCVTCLRYSRHVHRGVLKLDDIE